MKKHLLFVPSSIRMDPYRTRLPAEFLNSLGLAETLVAETKLFSQMAVWADVVVFQCQIAPKMLKIIDELHSAGKTFVYDLDDNVHEAPEDTPTNQWLFENREETLAQFQEILATSDHVIVSSERLRDYYGKDDPRFHVIPNGLDFDRFQPDKNKGAGEKFRVGWTGSSSHFHDLEMVAPQLLELRRAHSDVELIFQGIVPPSIVKECVDEGLTGVERHAPVAYEDYPQSIHAMNINAALLPLRDNAFNYCKSNIKLVEMSALGIPVVASEVTPYSRWIDNGKSGFLVPEDRPHLWQEHLLTLRANPDLCNSMARKALETLREEFDIRNLAPRYLEIFTN